jgi:2-iminoacetate synthase
MDLAKPGLIQKFCRTNAILTFKEHLLDYASAETRAPGDRLSERLVAETKGAGSRRTVTARLEQLETGKRDIYV